MSVSVQYEGEKIILESDDKKELDAFKALLTWSVPTATWDDSGTGPYKSVGVTNE